MLLNLITPCSRPDNLKLILNSVVPATQENDIKWHVIFDKTKVKEIPEQAQELALQHSFIHLSDLRDGKSIFGNSQRNKGIDLVQTGWVYFLDDDNLLHPNLIKQLNVELERSSTTSGFIFEQDLGKAIRPAKVEIGYIDLAQCFVKREIIGNTRFSVNKYEADGLFITAIYRANPGKFKQLENVLCYYNKLNLS